MSKLGDGTMANGSWTKGAGMAQGGDPTAEGAQLHIPLMVGFMIQVRLVGGAGCPAPARTSLHPAPMLVFTKVN